LSPAESGKLISCKAQQVRIVKEGVELCSTDIVGKVERGEMVMAEMFVKTPVHPQKSDDAGINWVFFADTLNFSFWNLETEPQYEVTYKGDKYTGYLAMCAAINRALDSGVNLTDPAYFVSIDEVTLGNLLIGDNGVPIPLLSQRFHCLQEVGFVLLNYWSGSFVNVLEAANNSAPRLLTLILDNFPCFRDSGMFEGERVSFHKRAQILVADIWCLFEGTGRGGMEDIDQLTMFADYRVPQSLQHYGVFQYGTELMNHLKQEKMMEPGHPWELEIRGCSVEAVERITKRVKELLDTRGVKAKVNSILIDQYLWGYRRQNAENMKNFPYHRVRSIFY